jgi:hypothetical protein
MIISKEMLRDAGACEEGRVWFDNKYPTGLVDINKLADDLADEGLFSFFQYILENIDIGSAPHRTCNSLVGGSYFAPYGVNIEGDVVGVNHLVSGGDVNCGGRLEVSSLDVYGALTVKGNVVSDKWIRTTDVMVVQGTLTVNCLESNTKNLHHFQDKVS